MTQKGTRRRTRYYVRTAQYICTMPADDRTADFCVKSE